MNSMVGENSHADIVRLMKAAAEAAELGRWDAVAEYYRERGALLETMQAPISDAHDLLKLDEEIRDRVNTVLAVLTTLAGEAAATRQRLHGLRRRVGVLSSAPETLSMEA